MHHTETSNPRLAVLIDADNTFRVINVIDALLEEISKFGDASIRRIYGDWTETKMQRWKEILPKYAIQPIQQYANTRGKNSTDSALIIDAMDLLYTAPLDGFCIVSSDSDFTRLATRLRESGKQVYGFGEEKTPDSLIAACNKFIYIEILSEEQLLSASESTPVLTPEAPPSSEIKPKTSTTSAVPQPSTPGVRKNSRELAMDARLIALIRSAISALSDDDGYAHIGETKKHMIKNFPAFDSRNYGYSKFSELIKATGLFEIDKAKQRIKDKRKK
ncbi:NYN domain-containing protein [Methylobacillus arboreus]|uniref:NYN domain-containing protein n=1 Tax=Methylobacillus arboreus TaxID=755170 RepID=UPI001E465E60|nr:NYN domain-containing protein [Methylobacillus arboreus]MCB5189449.1 NYN domain-containing protein [Methylobacillus arboreus]